MKFNYDQYFQALNKQEVWDKMWHNHAAGLIFLLQSYMNTLSDFTVPNQPGLTGLLVFLARHISILGP